MPNTFLRYIHLICLCIVMQMAHAYDFEAEGLYYSFHNSNQVKVSGCDKNKTGSLVIPKTVTFNGETYQVTSIAFGAFVNCTSLTSITIPNSVTTIGNYAFQLCSNLTSVSIPNSVTAIEAETFSGCTSLTSITIPNSVTAIKGSAFYGCSGLTSITIPNSVTAIGYQAFYGCSGLTSITIPNSVTSIGNYAFSECFGLTSVAIGNSITSIGYAVFYNCSGLTSITIPNSVTVIEAEAFDGCTSLTSVTIGNFVMSIGNFAFCGCKGLTSVIIPNSVTAIGESAFYGCSSLTSVTIPNSVTAIGRGAFYKCNGLTSVTIPNSVTAIGNSAFGQCNSLKSVCTKITNPFTVNCFDNTSNATLIVPKGTKSTYESLSGWNGFKEIKEEGVNNYSISITVNDNGSASYNNTTIRGGTRSFTIEEGSSATVLVTPDDGYRIASVKLNDKDVTSDVANSQYTISNITANANIDVTFEPTPVPITPLYQTTLKQTWEKLSYHGIDVYDLGWDYVPNKNGRYYDENSKSIRQQQTNDTDIKYSFNYLGELYALEGLVWDQIPDYSGNRYGDEEGWAEDIYTSCKDSRIHIWDSPQEALADPDGAAIKIYCDPGGWDLKPYLGLHCLRKDSESEFSSYFPYRISRVSASDLGLHYEFEFVDYCSSINRTYESRYAKFSDWNVEQWNKKPSKSGILIPQGVDENGKTTDYFSTGIDGHEPLVRVMLKDESGNVLLDGYILVRIISNSYKVNTGSTNRAIDNIPILETNHVSGYSITLSSTWSQFSYLILQKGLNGMPISVFDEYYRAECKSGGTVSNNDINYVTSNAREMLLEGTHGYQLKLYNFGTDIYGNDGTPPIQGSANAEISNSLENKELGTAIYFPHGGGTNHTFAWTLSDDEIKYLSKGKASPFTVSRWFCYGAKNSMAPYPNIWVKMTMKISTKQEPVKTFLLNISSTGNGSVTYDNTAVRNNTRSFTIDEGTSATVLITPDVGYRIASVKSNDKDVTASVANNQYTISNITANTKLDVVFEAIPPTTYTLSITSSGNGSVTYDNIAVRNGSRSFTINEGTSAKILFASDEGYRIKSVKVNNAVVTVTNNQYTINNITANATVNVEFEAIPITTYTLSVSVTGNGAVAYNSNSVRSKTASFTLHAGTSATVSFSPDNGYRIASVKLNDKDVTANVVNNQYTISNITANAKLDVTFEAIPATTYTLSVTSSGNGSVTYDNTAVRNGTRSFTINEGTSAKITFTPDNGYYIWKVKVNNSLVSVSNNQYTISDISDNTSVTVEFFTGDAGIDFQERIVYVDTDTEFVEPELINPNNVPVTYISTDPKVATVDSVTGKVTILKAGATNITAKYNDSDNPEFDCNAAYLLMVLGWGGSETSEHILEITSSGNGQVTYEENSIRNNTISVSVKDGNPVTMSLMPDTGYRIAYVKRNGVDVTADVSNNSYTIEGVSDNYTLDIAFEVIPPTTYTLSITSSGNGNVTYDNNAIRNNTRSFTINEGTSAAVSISPDDGYRIASVKLNGKDVTANVASNQYTVSNMTANAKFDVTFEAIPPTTYTLSITSSGNGSVTYDNITVRNNTRSFSIDEGLSVTLTFTSDNGYRIKNVKVNNLTVSTSNNQYTIPYITNNTTVEVIYETIPPNEFIANGINYKVVSQSEKTVKVVGGDYGQVLTIPATVSQDGTTWKVTGIEKDALKGIAALCAVIWEPEALFTADVSNTNLLLYVKDTQYAPADIKNVVVNGSATSITLVDANSGNSFFCPQAFTVQKISYTHHYGMITGIGESRGWETIALPFDVQTVTHAVKGTCRPFANWKSGDDARPFWLYELTGSGFAEATGIEAYTPYVISMPNHPRYEDEWILRGNVTFAATNTVVKKTEDVKTVTYGDRTFVPCFADMAADAGFYALNVNNDLSTNTNGMTEGSRFVLNMRKIHPFEAYMISTSNASRWYFDIFERVTTAIKEIEKEMLKVEHIYDLQGRKTQKPHKKGIYVTDGKKLIVR